MINFLEVGLKIVSRNWSKIGLGAKFKNRNSFFEKLGSQIRDPSRTDESSVRKAIASVRHNTVGSLWKYHQGSQDSHVFPTGRCPTCDHNRRSDD